MAVQDDNPRGRLTVQYATKTGFNTRQKEVRFHSVHRCSSQPSQPTARRAPVWHAPSGGAAPLRSSTVACMQKLLEIGAHLADWNAQGQDCKQFSSWRALSAWMTLVPAVRNAACLEAVRSSGTRTLAAFKSQLDAAFVCRVPESFVLACANAVLCDQTGVTWLRNAVITFLERLVSAFLSLRADAADKCGSTDYQCISISTFTTHR